MQRRILFLTPQLPYPPEQGTAIRNYHLIAQAATRYDVSLLSFAEPGATDPGPLAQICSRVEVVPAPRRSLAQRLRTLLASRAPDMARRLASEPFARTLRSMLAEGRYDTVQVEGIELAAYGLMLDDWPEAGAPALVFDDHNAEYLLQQRAFATDLRRPRRWPQAAYSCAQWLRLRRFERQVCRRADAVLAVSEMDARAIRRLAPEIEPLAIPNGVDTQGYRTDLPDSLPLRHPNLVFTGKMDFRPNIDAMRWFHAQVWPEIRRRAPQVQLYIVGKAPHPEVQRLAEEPGITVTGYVSEILPYFGGADVYIVPLRVGGGTRLKVLEALATGLPMVSTRLGAEGIELVDGEHALLADTPGAFAEAALRLLHDEALRQRLGRQARAFAEEHYDWRQIVPRLYPLYDRLAPRR
jgi:sugar transferase (PEP-CTERM/EpsH1 system associated)